MNFEEVYIKDQELELLRLLVKEDFKQKKLETFDKEASKKLFRAPDTINGWRRNLMKKFFVKNTKELIKKVTGLVILMLLYFSSFSQNFILGGRINYYYIDTSNYDTTKMTYLVSLRLYTQQPGSLPDSATFYMWNRDDTSLFAIHTQPREGIFTMPEAVPCVAGMNLLNIFYARYSWTVDLPPNTNGWLTTWQGGCQ